MTDLVMVFVCFAAGMDVRAAKRLPENGPTTINGFIITIAVPTLILAGVLAPAAALYFVLGSGGASAMPSSACPLISLATAEAIFGKPIPAGADAGGDGYVTPLVCMFSDPNSPATVSLAIQDAEGANASTTQKFEAFVAKGPGVDSQTEHVGGLGDDAIYVKSKAPATSIWVLSGSVVLGIHTNGPNYLPSREALKAALTAAATTAVKGL